MTRSAATTDIRVSGFVIPSAFGLRHSSFRSRHSCLANPSRFRNRKCFLLLLLLLFGLVFPLLDAVVVDAAEREEFFFVVNHLLPARAGQRVIFHQEDGFFGTNLLAITAEDAAEHIDLEFLW